MLRVCSLAALSDLMLINSLLSQQAVFLSNSDIGTCYIICYNALVKLTFNLEDKRNVIILF